MGNELTTRQKEVFEFLKDYLRAKGFPPTLREIASHFGLRGPKAPQKTLSILERKGYIRKVPGGSRAIEILSYPTIQSHPNTSDPHCRKSACRGTHSRHREYRGLPQPRSKSCFFRGCFFTSGRGR